MKSNLIIPFIPLFLLTVLFLSTSSYSQTDQGHLFTMTMVKVPNDQINDFLSFFETEGKPLDAENEHVLSVKVFTHAWGPEWTVCMVAEHKDWEGFLAAQKKYDELFAKKYPDQSKRDEINKKWGSFLTGHTDAIVFDHPKLQK